MTAYTSPFVVLSLAAGDEIEFDGCRWIVHENMAIMGRGRANRLVERYQVILLPIDPGNRTQILTVYAPWRARRFKVQDPTFSFTLVEKQAWKREWLIEG